MDVLKPLRQGGCKSALARNVRFSYGGRAIARFPGNLCDRNPGVRLEVSSARSLLWRYAGCYLGHNKTNCGAEVIKKTSSAPKVARGATLCNVRFSCVGNAIARFLGDLRARIWGLGFAATDGSKVQGSRWRARSRCSGTSLAAI